MTLLVQRMFTEHATSCFVLFNTVTQFCTLSCLVSAALYLRAAPSGKFQDTKPCSRALWQSVMNIFNLAGSDFVSDPVVQLETIVLCDLSDSYFQFIFIIIILSFYLTRLNFNMIVHLFYKSDMAKKTYNKICVT